MLFHGLLTTYWGKSVLTQLRLHFLTRSGLIQPNGANLTGGGTGGAFETSGSSATPSFIEFSGGVLPMLPAGFTSAVIVGLCGALIGAIGVYGRL